jgi:hypothetical protein
MGGRVVVEVDGVDCFGRVDVVLVVDLGRHNSGGSAEAKAQLTRAPVWGDRRLGAGGRLGYRPGSVPVSSVSSRS